MVTGFFGQYYGILLQVTGASKNVNPIVKYHTHSTVWAIFRTFVQAYRLHITPRRLHGFQIPKFYRLLKYIDPSKIL